MHDENDSDNVGGAGATHPPSLHAGEHWHDGEQHRHVHHHPGALPVDAHEHAHTQGFERYTYLCSPIHGLDPRFKLIGAFVLVIGVVAGAPLRVGDAVFVAAVLLATAVLTRIPLSWLLKRSALVLPVAVGIAAFAPLSGLTQWSLPGIAHAYATDWILIWAIVSKAWVSAFAVLLVSATTTPPRLFKALRALKMPDIFLTMLSFLYRYVDVMREQLRSLRRTIASRGWALSRWQLVRLYGNLAGNLLIRAYERGERVYASMLSRGYDGVLPSAEVLQAKASDWLVVFTAALVAGVTLLY